MHQFIKSILLDSTFFSYTTTTHLSFSFLGGLADSCILATLLSTLLSTFLYNSALRLVKAVLSLNRR